jgi:hypothetical protein
MQEYDIDESNFDNLVLHESVPNYEYSEELLISDTKDIEESIEEITKLKNILKYTTLLIQEEETIYKRLVEIYGVTR